MSEREVSQVFYGNSSGAPPLPFPKPLRLPENPNPPALLPTFIAESCGIRLVQSAAMGGVMGVAMGLFLGAMGDMGPIQVMHGREVPQAPLKEQMRQTWRMTAERSVSWGKNFAVFTGVIMGIECVVEKYRGKHDIWNSVISGCATGAIFGAQQGPQAACLGCMGFAAFSAVMDTIMGQH